MKLRDQALIAVFDYLGMNASIDASNNAQIGHGRLFEIEWSNGRKLIVRLDQGVSYWRAAHTNSRVANYFDVNERDADLQGGRLAELSLNIEGAELPTQLFVKAR